MQLLLYAPYGYALVLLVIGFIAARQRNWNGYFWGALVLAEISRLGQMLFLVQNFGHPVYLFQFRGQNVALIYTGLYVAGAAAFGGILAGIILFWRHKKPFPGMWVAVLSAAELMMIGLLRAFL